MKTSIYICLHVYYCTFKWSWIRHQASNSDASTLMSYDMLGTLKCPRDTHRASGLQIDWRLRSPGAAAQGWARYHRAYEIPLKNYSILDWLPRDFFNRWLYQGFFSYWVLIRLESELKKKKMFRLSTPVKFQSSHEVLYFQWENKNANASRLQFVWIQCLSKLTFVLKDVSSLSVIFCLAKSLKEHYSWLWNNMGCIYYLRTVSSTHWQLTTAYPEENVVWERENICRYLCIARFCLIIFPRCCCFPYFIFFFIFTGFLFPVVFFFYWSERNT